jgi:hypothetical protein
MGKPREIAAFALVLADKTAVTRELLGSFRKIRKNFGKLWLDFDQPRPPYI